MKNFPGDLQITAALTQRDVQIKTPKWISSLLQIAYNCCSGFGVHNISAEFEMVDISNDLAALRYWFSSNSSLIDPLDLEVQRIFQHKDDDA